MGLFTGFSVISGVELLYWIIFKVNKAESILYEKDIQIFLCVGVFPQEGHRVLRRWFCRQEGAWMEGTEISKWGHRRYRGDYERALSSSKLQERTLIQTFNYLKSTLISNPQVSSDKEDVEAGAKVAEASTSCCQVCGKIIHQLVKTFFLLPGVQGACCQCQDRGHGDRDCWDEESAEGEAW